MDKWDTLRLMLDEGRYSIDEEGNVWSHYKGRTRLKATRIKRGYREVKLRHKGKYYYYGIHQIQAYVSYGITSTREYSVDHIDRNKLNNKPCNLRMATQKEQRANTNECYRGQPGELNHCARITNEQVRQLRLLALFQLFNVPELARLYGLDVEYTRRIKNGKARVAELGCNNNRKL